MNERRFNEKQIAEILQRAAESDVTQGEFDRGQSLTLAELQEIGAEVGIPPARIAEEARALELHPRRFPTFLGTPRYVARAFPISRALSDEDWFQLVADIRQTFGAIGQIKSYGSLRSWTNGNLQVHVEPEADHYRVRMQTLKGNAVIIAAAAGAIMVSAVMSLVTAVAAGVDVRAVATSALLGLAGVGILGYVRASLPQWAAQRAAQMEALEQRVRSMMDIAAYEP